MADIAYATQPFKLRPLSIQEAAASGFTHVATITGVDINDTAGAQGDTITVTLGTTPTEFLIKSAVVYVETAFATTGTLTVSIGSSGSVASLVVATDAKTQGPIVTEISGDAETLAGSFGTAAVTLVARFATQAATGAPGDITAGKLHVLLNIIDLAALTA